MTDRNGVLDDTRSLVAPGAITEEVSTVVLCGPSGVGYVAFVDTEDMPKIEAYRWYLSAQGYATQRHGITMHRVVMNAQPGQSVDHVNGCKLDNRRSNLRIANQSQNCANAGKHKHSKQPYKGIRLTASGKWQARIRLHGDEIPLGTYASPVEAARVYDRAAQDNFGVFANLNFPEGNE